jgi:hypothetical protein
MDPAAVGWIGGIAGGAVGVIGAAIGVYASLGSAKSAAERRFLWIGTSVFCVLIGGHLAALFFIPQPWNGLSWLVYPPLLIATIFWFNRRQTELRQEGENGGACSADGS